jgi:hypothetical protein
MLAAKVLEHLGLSGFEIDEVCAAREEAPADPRPRVAPAFVRSVGSASNRFSSARAACSLFAAALRAVRPVAASSSRSALLELLLPVSPIGHAGEGSNKNAPVKRMALAGFPVRLGYNQLPGTTTMDPARARRRARAAFMAETYLPSRHIRHLDCR